MRDEASIARSIVTFVALGAVASAIGCSDLMRILDFEKQGQLAREMVRIEGRIESDGPHEGVLVVILGRIVADGSDELIGVDSYVRVDPGSYAFMVSPGRFRVGAYEDRNRNGLLDPGERHLPVDRATVLEVGPSERAHHDMTLADAEAFEGGEPLDVLAIVERTPEAQREFSLWNLSRRGEICRDLTDARFGPRAGRRGLWEPMDFLNDGLAGIYFLETYDPKRVPVLFVHGISGYPREFRTLIEGLDPDRFQAWFYFYPSGFSLDGIAHHLAEMLKRLYAERGFDELAIVAHSMGGLVARGAILAYERETKRRDVRLFISLSTPWAGEPRAAGADEARVELPTSFADMAPSSAYMRSLFYEDGIPTRRKNLPSHTEFHMLIGFRMTRAGDVANDGKVSVASQARVEAQEEAASVRAWNYTHADMLVAPESVARVNRLLHERFD